MVAVIVEHGSPQILRRHRLEEIFNCLHIVALQNKIGAGGHEDDADPVSYTHLYSKPDATRAEITAAARAARVDFFVRTMSHGYDTVLTNDAENISIGQRQLLTIARVFLCNPAVIILDEATSSVDTRTEVEIGKAMKALMKGRTSFVIAHRLSTIVDADLILFMQDGDIIEQGNHASLLKAKGAYADLYYSQFA